MTWVMETKQITPMPGLAHIDSIPEGMTPEQCLTNIIGLAQEFNYVTELEPGPVLSYLVSKGRAAGGVWRIRVFEITDCDTEPFEVVPEHSE